MIKPAALILAAAMAAVSAGTYYGLDLLPPGAIPEPFGRAQKAEPPKPGTHAAASAPTQTAAAAPAQPAPAPAEQPVTEQDLAEEPPPPSEQPAAQAQAEPAPAAAPEPAAPAPAPQAAAPAPEPQPAKAAAAPADEPAAKPAPKKRAPVTVVREDEARQEVASAAAPSAPVKPRPPEADVIKPWWPDSSKLPPNQLKLQYAGQVQGEQAIALLFSAPLNVDSLRQHAQVKTGTGEPVKGGWELGKNPRLAVFRGVGSGRYTVILAPQIADTKGFMLGQTLKGPVYIQPPQ